MMEFSRIITLQVSVPSETTTSLALWQELQIKPQSFYKEWNLPFISEWTCNKYPCFSFSYMKAPSSGLRPTGNKAQTIDTPGTWGFMHIWF